MKCSPARPVTFHESLNSRLWQGDDLKKDVRVALLAAAIEFYKFLDVPGLSVIDVRITGSNAAYSYTPHSDIDVHLIADYSSIACQEMAENLFMTKKALWAEMHDLKVKGIAVELYVENSRDEAVSNGVYSLKRGKWLSRPVAKKPQMDDKAVAAKFCSLRCRADDIVAAGGPLDSILALLKTIHRMRSAGLDREGEFSTENLVYKALRDSGTLDRLWKLRLHLEDEDLSLESVEHPSL